VKQNGSAKDTLREQYEDSLFRLLMDDFVEEEGQRLLEENENLKKDTDFVLPNGLEARGEKTIRETFEAKRRMRSWQSAKKILSRVAVIALACGVAFVTLFSTVSAFREAVNKILLNDETVNTDIGFKGSNVTGKLGNQIEVPSGAYLPTWLPEGYTFDSYERSEFQAIATYKNDSGNNIYYYELKNEPVLGADTEEADSTENISINGYDGLVIVKGATISITWVDSKRNIFARIKTLNIDKETAIKIAQSII